MQQDIISGNIWTLLGLPIDAVSEDDAVAYLHHAIVNDQRCFLTTPNLNFVISAMSDADFKRSVIESDFIIADGMPLVWLSKLLGMAINERVTGSGVFQRLRFCGSKDNPIKVFFFGGPEGVAEQAFKNLNDEDSPMQAAGFYYPGFGSINEMSEPHIINTINESGANFLVVALGAKRGQEWIMRNKSKLQTPVISHLGAVVNFVGGTVARSPVFLQRIGFEWLWRIYEEHSLLKRYWNDGLTFLNTLLTRVAPLWWYRRCGEKRLMVSNELNIFSSLGLNELFLTCSGVMAATNVDLLFDYVTEFFNIHISIDLTGIDYLDFSAMASLQLIESKCKLAGGKLVLINPQAHVRRALEHNMLSYLL